MRLFVYIMRVGGKYLVRLDLWALLTVMSKCELGCMLEILMLNKDNQQERSRLRSGNPQRLYAEVPLEAGYEIVRQA